MVVHLTNNLVCSSDAIIEEDGIPNAFQIPMVALRSVSQWCSILNKMAAILSKTFVNLNKLAPILLL